MNELSEQEQIRINKLDELRNLGINPYPSDEFIIDTKTIDILNNYDNYEGKTVKLAGRLMSKRIMGGASFCELQDNYDKIQIYIQRDSICNGENKDLYNIIFKKLIDLGDFIGIQGYVFKTKVGEISIHIEKLILLSKSLKPLPCVKDGTNLSSKIFRLNIK